jgi:hypothetical protein
MIRENRFLVLKRSDIADYLTQEQQEDLQLLCTIIETGRNSDGKHYNQYVCIADDWPEYEQVWKMIEARVDNNPKP